MNDKKYILKEIIVFAIDLVFLKSSKIFKSFSNVFVKEFYIGVKVFYQNVILHAKKLI